MGGTYEVKTIVTTLFNITRPEYDYPSSDGTSITTGDVTMSMHDEGYTIDIDYGLWYHRSGARQLVDVLIETSEIIAPFNTLEFWTEVIYQFNKSYEKRTEVQELFRKIIDWSSARELIEKQVEQSDTVKNSITTRLVDIEPDKVI